MEKDVVDILGTMEERLCWARRRYYAKDAAPREDWRLWLPSSTHPVALVLAGTMDTLCRLCGMPGWSTLEGGKQCDAATGLKVWSNWIVRAERST